MSTQSSVCECVQPLSVCLSIRPSVCLSVCLSFQFFCDLIKCRELENGINIYDEEGNELGRSKIAARKAVSQVVVSRIGMAAPGMGL